MKNSDGEEVSWTLEFKSKGEVYAGKPKVKADVTLNMADETFVELAQGKINGQKAFMSGKLKIKGNMMLSTRLDLVLKSAKPSSKL